LYEENFVSHQQRYFSLGLVLLSICSVLFIVRGYISETHTLHSRDFKPVYAASRCLLAGCNPYDIAATKQEYLGAGGTMEDNLAFQPHNSTYPPGTFFLILPVAWLPWSWADAVWLALIAIAMVYGSIPCGGPVPAIRCMACHSLHRSITAYLQNFADAWTASGCCHRFLRDRKLVFAEASL
jgi:hypothetical protein